MSACPASGLPPSIDRSDVSTRDHASMGSAANSSACLDRSRRAIAGRAASSAASAWRCMSVQAREDWQSLTADITTDTEADIEADIATDIKADITTGNARRN